MSAPFLLLMFVLYVALVLPIYVIGQRTGVRNAWAAFLPLLGAWIVLLEAIRRSGWLSLLVFIPYVGALVLVVWTAIELPSRHARTRWWTLVFLVPVANVVGYWFYAFTLPREPSQVVFAA